jgi:hypothetical protein
MTKPTLTRRAAISAASVSVMRCSPRCGDCVFYVSNFGRADDTPNTPVREPNSPGSRMFAAWRLRGVLRGSSPSGEAARFPGRRQALVDCDKLATRALPEKNESGGIPLRARIGFKNRTGRQASMRWGSRIQRIYVSG